MGLESAICVLLMGSAMRLNSEAAISIVYRLSARLSVTMTVGPAGFVVEWEPDLPTQLTAEELHAYRGARAELLAELARSIGRPVLLVDPLGHYEIADAETQGEGREESSSPGDEKPRA